MHAAFRYFLELNALVAALALVLTALSRALKARALRLSHGTVLAAAYAGLLVAVLAPFLEWESGEHPFGPLVQTYSGEKYADFALPGGRRVLKISALPHATSEALERELPPVDALFLGLTALGLAAFAALAFASVRRVRRLENQALPLRRCGGNAILVHPQVGGPFSVRLPGRRLVFLPEGILGQRGHLALAVKHELQHHRQGDTLAVWGTEALRCALFYNPFSWALHDLVGKLQELACDEALIGRWEVSSRDYASCLLEAAAQPWGGGRIVGTARLSAPRTF